MTQMIRNDKIDKWIANYVSMRDAKRALVEEQAKTVKEYDDILDMLEGRLQAFFNENGLSNVKTINGTAFQSTTYRATLADPALFMEYVIENKKYDLLDRKANTAAVRGFVEANKTLPPGCNLTAMTKINIRRPTEKED